MWDGRAQYIAPLRNETQREAVRQAMAGSIGNILRPLKYRNPRAFKENQIAVKMEYGLKIGGIAK